MILNKKQIKKIIIVFVSVLVIVLVVFFLTRKQAQKLDNSNTNQEPTAEEMEKSVPKIDNKVVPKEVSLESKVTTIARNFAERLGSYSTDNKEENFSSIWMLGTSKMQSDLKTIIASNEKLNGSDYYGVSSKFLKAEVNIAESLDKANVIVDLRQVENENGKETRKNIKLNLDLLKVDEAWLVDGVKWE